MEQGDHRNRRRDLEPNVKTEAHQHMNIPRKQDGRLLRWGETPKIKSLLSIVI
jgi:hypothetical protein